MKKVYIYISLTVFSFHYVLSWDVSRGNDSKSSIQRFIESATQTEEAIFWEKTPKEIEVLFKDYLGTIRDATSLSFDELAKRIVICNLIKKRFGIKNQFDDLGSNILYLINNYTCIFFHKERTPSLPYENVGYIRPYEKMKLVMQKVKVGSAACPSATAAQITTKKISATAAQVTTKKISATAAQVTTKKITDDEQYSLEYLQKIDLPGQISTMQDYFNTIKNGSIESKKVFFDLANKLNMPPRLISKWKNDSSFRD